VDRKLRYSILAGDLLWLAATLAIAHGHRGSAADMARVRPLAGALAVLAVWAALFLTKGLEGFRGGWRLPHICAQVTVGVSYLIAILWGFTAAINKLFSPAELFYLACFLPPGFVSIRCLTWWLAVLRSRRRPKRRVVILGSGRLVRELTLKIARRPELSMEVAGVLFPSDMEPAAQTEKLSSGAMSIRTLDVLDLMRDKEINDLIVIEPLPPGTETAKLISNCKSAGVLIHLVPQRYQLYVSKARLTEIDDVPLLSLEEQSPPIVGLEVKGVVDLIGAFVLLFLSTPLLLLAAGALYVAKGRAFRRELRCGKNGSEFWMYRLDIDRDAPDLRAGEWILAQSGLTELPQLWNILKGEMSLVGPRPEAPDRVKHYSDWQRQRLSVIPGLTGLAQVNGLREQHSSEAKARFDLQYIFHWSMFLDLSLLVQTVWILFQRLLDPDALRSSSIMHADVESRFPLTTIANANSTQSGAD
jgi:lipopolysaccharide/colanic/teichoic acid biosynthesis glycosyltransferase